MMTKEVELPFGDYVSFLNELRPADSYVHYWNGSSMVQEYASRMMNQNTFSLRIIHMKMLFAKWRQFCSRLIVYFVPLFSSRSV